jgi:crossover junction endodeoxyribonuclease RuvC
MTRYVGIDPATCTGFCAIDERGNVLVEVELGKSVNGGLTIPQLIELENKISTLLEPDDVIMFESPGFATQKAVTTGMIHGGLRTAVHRKGLTFDEVTPAQVKKYVGVTGWIVEEGKKRRLVDKEKKAAIKEAVLERFGYTHNSHNVVDAFILAQIS